LRKYKHVIKPTKPFERYLIPLHTLHASMSTPSKWTQTRHKDKQTEKIHSPR